MDADKLPSDIVEAMNAAAAHYFAQQSINDGASWDALHPESRKPFIRAVFQVVQGFQQAGYYLHKVPVPVEVEVAA